MCGQILIDWVCVFVCSSVNTDRYEVCACVRVNASMCLLECVCEHVSVRVYVRVNASMCLLECVCVNASMCLLECACV